MQATWKLPEVARLLVTLNLILLVQGELGVHVAFRLITHAHSVAL